MTTQLPIKLMWFICVKMKYEGWNFVAHLFPNLKWMTGLLGGSFAWGASNVPQEF
jgi:hypothetical protein